MIPLLLASVSLATLAALAVTFAPRAELVTEVHISAPPSRVWAVLADGASYSSWNPFLTSMHGTLVAGGTLTNIMRPGGGKPMTFTPTLLAVTPEKELRWLGRFLLPRLFDGEHYLMLDAVEGGTRLRHGERFIGIAFWFMSPEQFRPDFEAMNAALKARVEGAG